MRLLHTRTFKLHSFYNNIPRYIILSHTWQDGEISLQDLEAGTSKDKAGWQKIYKFCELARSREFEYAWIDTCCIDKTSSAELQETINSMFRYYRQSELCIAYLSDVCSGMLEPDKEHPEFRRSKWFTRGWTLQELIAPQQLEFVAQDWITVLGTKSGLVVALESITRIPQQYLLKFGEPYERRPSAQQIMSWASTRNTTREEDEAYCLFGLFGISMALLYGEGRKAFRRLQEEIIRTFPDETIFAWTCNRDFMRRNAFDLFAPSAASFKQDRIFRRPLPWAVNIDKYPPYALTNAGLRIQRNLFVRTGSSWRSLCFKLAPKYAFRRWHDRVHTFYLPLLVCVEGPPGGNDEEDEYSRFSKLGFGLEIVVTRAQSSKSTVYSAMCIFREVHDLRKMKAFETRIKYDLILTDQLYTNS